MDDKVCWVKSLKDLLLYRFELTYVVKIIKTIKNKLLKYINYLLSQKKNPDNFIKDYEIISTKNRYTVYFLDKPTNPNT